MIYPDYDQPISGHFIAWLELPRRKRYWKLYLGFAKELCSRKTFFPSPSCGQQATQWSIVYDLLPNHCWTFCCVIGISRKVQMKAEPTVCFLFLSWPILIFDILIISIFFFSLKNGLSDQYFTGTATLGARKKKTIKNKKETHLSESSIDSHARCKAWVLAVILKQLTEVVSFWNILYFCF